MFSFSPGQGLVEHALDDISWDYGWKLYEKKEKVMLNEKKRDKVAKEEGKKEKKRKEKKREVFHCVFLKFYVDGA
jgi:hypothetical protein